MANAVLLTSCPDRPGLVRAVARFINEHTGNIVHLDQHVDPVTQVFYMRVEWELGDDAGAASFKETFSSFASETDMTWSVNLTATKERLALFVSKESHCLYDLLARHAAGELPVEIPLVVSNHETLRSAAERFGIPFHVFPITKETKAEQEAKELELLAEFKIDTVILARYMQIISPQMIAEFPDRIINIHHSFLPAFAGAKPYHQAHARGVKLIGATSHYVTADLDAGPIIAQDVQRVGHQHSVKELVRIGRDLEKIVLSRAVWAHVHHRVIARDNRTVVF